MFFFSNPQVATLPSNASTASIKTPAPRTLKPPSSKTPSTTTSTEIPKGSKQKKVPEPTFTKPPSSQKKRKHDDEEEKERGMGQEVSCIDLREHPRLAA